MPTVTVFSKNVNAKNNKNLCLGVWTRPPHALFVEETAIAKAIYILLTNAVHHLIKL